MHQSNKVVNDVEIIGNEAQEVNKVVNDVEVVGNLKKSMRIDVKVVGSEALFMNVNEVVNEIEGVNIVPTDEVQGFNNGEDYEYLSSYLSRDDESFLDVDMYVEPNRKSNKTSTEGQDTCINVENDASI